MRGPRRARIEAVEVDRAAATERVHGRMKEAILRGTVIVDTTGERVGQVNGLSVFELGGHAFSEPTRITATTRTGEGRVVDIQLHAALSLVRITGSELVVPIAAADRAAFLRNKEDAQGQLGAARARLQQIPAGNWPAALEAALAHGAIALVRPRSNGYETAAVGAAMLPPLPCSLVLIP